MLHYPLRNFHPNLERNLATNRIGHAVHAHASPPCLTQFANCNGSNLFTDNTSAANSTLYSTHRERRNNSQWRQTCGLTLYFCIHNKILDIYYLTSICTGWFICPKCWVRLTVIWWVHPAVGPLLYLPTAQAGWWNIPNLSQPNPTVRSDAPPCTATLHRSL